MHDKLMAEGGPAFPLPGGAGDSTVQETYLGMTLRDWFAGQALSGLAAHDSNRTDTLTAFYAYEMADAMLAERPKRKGRV